MMGLDIPAWGAGELMVKARKKLFKIGWRQEASERLDCIEKDFDGITVRTIWAGNHLLLSYHKTGVDPDSSEAYVDDVKPTFEKVKTDIEPIFERIVRRNKKKWNAEITEYERRHGLVYTRNEKYGV